MAATLNLSVDQGADFSRAITLTDSAGAPVNITGASLKGQVRESVSARSKLADFAFTITDAVNGKFTVSLTATQTSGFVAGSGTSHRDLASYPYDIFITEASGDISRLFEGVIQVSPAVTR